MYALLGYKTLHLPHLWRLVAVCAVILASTAPMTAYAENGDLISLGPPVVSQAVPSANLPNKANPSSDVVKEDQGFLGQLIIFLNPGIDPVEFGKANALTYLDTLKSDSNAHIYLAGGKTATTLAMTSLAASPAVRKVYENRRSQNVLHAFVPDDPYFHKQTPAGWTGPGQWHLKNEYFINRDVGVMTLGYSCWALDMTGLGVKMAVVDDSLQRTHPDIAPNYDAADSWDFGQGDADPYPVFDDDRHGCSTSGVAAARGGNGKGVTGVAPFAKIAGLRIDFPNQTDAMFVDATLYHSSGPNTNIQIKNHSYGVSSTYISNTAQNDALSTSAAAGTIHVLSAGNDRGYVGQDANKKMLQANLNAITVAARGSDGVFASYSNFGANVFCTQMSSSGSGLYRITTTDRTGIRGYNTDSGDTFPDAAYTSIFGGTSSSAPTVAGALAILKQVQPALNTRFAKHLLARYCDHVIDTSDATETSDGGWRANGAGNYFNQNYGFGKVYLPYLYNRAREFTGVSDPWYAYGNYTINTPIPDNDTTGVSHTVYNGYTTPMEEATVRLNVSHTWRGDIEAYLTSPSGYTSRLMLRDINDNLDNFDWVFTTNAFWGENPQGNWTTKVVDRFSGDAGTWNNYSIYLHGGQLIPDTAGPVVTVNQATFQADPCQGMSVAFDVHFDEWVTDFTADDVVIGGTALPTTVSILRGVGRDYVIRVSGMTKHGTVTATIPAGTVTDALGQANTVSTSTDNEVTWNFKPRNLYISPNTGALTAGIWRTISSAHDDYNGASDILKSYLLLNHSLTQVGGAVLQYDVQADKLYLKNDAGTSWGIGRTPGTAYFLTNSQISVDVANTQALISGKNLVVKWRVRLTAPFPSTTLYGWQLVQDTGFLSTPWQLMGTY